MVRNELTTAWIWPTGSGDVNGATIDPIDGVIHWFSSGIGCACGESAIEQRYADYRQKGAPLANAPHDICAEILVSLDVLESA